MNTELFMQPEIATEELAIKLKAQRYQMHESWLSVTYQETLSNAPTVIDQGLRNNPTKGQKRGIARRIEAAKMHANLFAINEKDIRPDVIIMTTLAWGAMNMPIGGAPSKGGILLVPSGFALSAWTNASKHEFWLVGEGTKKAVPFPFDSMRKSTEYGINVAHHYPPLDYTKSDTENPQVTFNDLLRRVGISNYYPIDFLTWTGKQYQFAITDFKDSDHGWHFLTPDQIIEHLEDLAAYNIQIAERAGENVGGTGEGDAENPDALLRGVPGFTATGVQGLVAQFEAGTGNIPKYKFTSRLHSALENSMDTLDIDVFLWRPYLVAEMLSGIFCARPGAETGYMLLSYPRSTIQVQEDTQELLITLRERHGCGIVNRQNLCLLPDIKCGGLINGHGNVLADRASEYVPPSDDDDDYGATGHDLVVMCKLKTTPWLRVTDDPLFVALNIQGPLSDVLKQKSLYDTNGAFSDVHETPEFGNVGAFDSGITRHAEMPIFPFCGRVWDRNLKAVHENNGHFEELDHPNQVSVLEGRIRSRPHQFHIAN
jgi:hypothetical protein